MRNKYNLSHIINQCGHIGRIQTLGMYPLTPGDSLSIQAEGIARLAPTRKEIVSECQVDICGFFVKYRHIYGDDGWKEYLNAGVDGDVNLNDTPISINANSRYAPYLTLNDIPSSLPLHAVAPYNFIYQRYFAVPNTDQNGVDGQSSFDDLTYFPNGEGKNGHRCRLYGRVAARLPHIFNGGTPVAGLISAAGFQLDLTANDAEVPATTELDIRDLAEVQSRYKSETDTTYFAAFYNDLLERKWGTRVNTDADKRPDYLFRETIYLSGQDINGTDDATIGSYVGKTLQGLQFGMPRRVFMEHGIVIVLAVFRYPLIHTDEKHPVLTTGFAPANYDYLIAEPERWKALQPEQFSTQPWLSSTMNYTPSDDVLMPYGQHYRYQPNNTHLNFRTIPGYPFTQWNPPSLYPLYYYTDNEYFDTFQTSQLGQWQIHASASVVKHSKLPGPLASIYTGAN